MDKSVFLHYLWRKLIQRSWLRVKRARIMLPLSFLCMLPISSSAQIQFEDVSVQAGMQHPVESWGSGWGDFNGDGFPDLWTNNHREAPSLYQNDAQGAFIDVIPSVWSGEVDVDTHGVAWADFDDDGDMDVLEFSGGRNSTRNVNKLYVNENGVLDEQGVARGIDYPYHGGRGGTWLDYNFDGELDVVSAGYPNANGNTFVTAIFEQSNGNFSDVSQSLGFDCDKKSTYAVLAEVSGDGVLDLICHGFTFPQKVYDMTTTPFTDITSLVPKAGIVLDTAFADFDGDLTTDIFEVRRGTVLSNVVQSSNTEVQSHLWTQNNEIGYDIEASGILTIDITSPQLRSEDIHIGAGDYNPPLNPNAHLRRITLDLASTDPIAQGILPAVSGEKGMFIGYNAASGKWQIRLINTWHWGVFVNDSPVAGVSPVGFNPNNRDKTPKLFLNKANGFVDGTNAAGLNLSMTCRPTLAGDFDNDMDVDIFVACSHAPENLANRLFANQGDGTFVEVANAGGASGTLVGSAWNASMADYDVDGFLDIHVTNGENVVPVPGGPDQLFRNLGNNNNWVELDLIGTVSNPHGIGARIIADAGGIQQLREQNGGIHSFTQNHQRIHFGLGSNQTLDKITVHWPSGIVQEFTGLQINQVHQLVESSGGGGSSACGEPNLSPDSEKGIFLWKDCAGSGEWHLRATAGGPTTVSHLGVVTSSANFINVTGHSIENSDSIDFDNDGNQQEIDYKLIMRNNGQDGVNFKFDGGSTTCLTASQPANVVLRLGVNKVVAPLPLDLNTLTSSTACSTPPPTIDPCGEPTISANSESGLFLWQDCSGAGDWHARATAGGPTSIQYVGGVTSSSGFSNITAYSLEGADTLDRDGDGDPLEIDYRMKMKNNGQDGFDFDFNSGGNTCLDLTSPTGLQVKIGASKTLAPVPLDLNTLSTSAACP